MYEEEMARNIVIAKERYEALVEHEVMYHYLVDGLFNTTGLSWDKKELSFDEDFIKTFLKAVDATRYEARRLMLKEEQGC